MSRRRYISTDISSDGKIADLAAFGLLVPLIYTWSIPHMDDWGRITGEAREFKMQVCPGLDVTVEEVEAAISVVVKVGLWVRYEVDGKHCISVSKPDSWFKHQSYINKSKRDDDSGSNYPGPDKCRKTPQNAEEHQVPPRNNEEEQGMPNNAASFSFSPSPLKESTATTGTNPFKLFESEGFGTISSVIGEKLGFMIDDYGERWVCEAMKEAAYYSKRSLPYVKSILERYKSSGIDEPWTQTKVMPFPKGGQAPRKPYQSRQEEQTQKLMREIKEEEERERERGQENIFDNQQHISELPYR